MCVLLNPQAEWLLAQYVTRMSAQKPWYASATNVISVLTVVDASSVGHPVRLLFTTSSVSLIPLPWILQEYLTRIIVPSVHDLKRTEMDVLRLLIWEQVVQISSMNADV